MQPFSYQKASTVPGAVQAVATPGTRFLAGGTGLYDLMKLGAETPAVIVDVNALQGLDAIELTPSELRIGALARMSVVGADPRIVSGFPALSEALLKAASQQLRNMASVGGNLLQRTRCNYFRTGEPYACNKRSPGSGCSAIEGLDRSLALLGTSGACIANYPGDWAIALVAFDAQLDITGPSGSRTIALERLHREPGETPHIETTLAQGEMITRIRVPASALGRASTYHKIRDRESYAFALTSSAVALEMDGDTVRNVRVALGGVASRPWRAREAEQSLVGRTLTTETARAAGDIAFRGSRTGRHNGFKVELGARTVADALMIAKERA